MQTLGAGLNANIGNAIWGRDNYVISNPKRTSHTLDLMATNPTDGEFGVLRQFYSQIEAVLDPVEVAKLLWQDGLLTDAQLDNAEQSSTPLEQRRADIMSAVRRVVRGAPKKLWVLITALEKCPASITVANKMRQALKSEI